MSPPQQDANRGNDQANYQPPAVTETFWPNIRTTIIESADHTADVCTCSICLSELDMAGTANSGRDLESARLLSCGHVVGAFCIRAWSWRSCTEAAAWRAHLRGHPLGLRFNLNPVPEEERRRADVACPICREPLACLSCGCLFAAQILPRAREDWDAIDLVPDQKPGLRECLYCAAGAMTHAVLAPGLVAASPQVQYAYQTVREFQHLDPLGPVRVEGTVRRVEARFRFGQEGWAPIHRDIMRVITDYSAIQAANVDLLKAQSPLWDLDHEALQVIPARRLRIQYPDEVLLDIWSMLGNMA